MVVWKNPVQNVLHGDGCTWTGKKLTHLLDKVRNSANDKILMHMNIYGVHCIILHMHTIMSDET